METPKYPVGPYQPEETLDSNLQEKLTAEIEAAPSLLRKAVKGLSEDQLNTLYKNWTIRQIVHHLADSHMNAYIRFKWALTEDKPLIKAYDENLWTILPDAKTGNLDAPLLALDGVHARWVQLLKMMTPDMFARAYNHPDGKTYGLNKALGLYSWHGRHHTSQILWIKGQKGWG